MLIFVIENHVLDWHSCQMLSSWNKVVIIIIIIISSSSSIPNEISDLANGISYIIDVFKMKL